MMRIKIGTRDSELALWQAKTVMGQLEYLGHECELVPVKATGDLQLDKPIYELGITGVFTKNLDIALLNGEIDIAVHSMKDVPTALPEGIVQSAVLKRGPIHDVLAYKNDLEFLNLADSVIATGSLRRKAAWLNRYPEHRVVDLRGNVNTRMQKLNDSEDWNGAIFAAAGLKRIGLKAPNLEYLDWMLPAPAQGAVVVTSLEANQELQEVLKEIDDKDTRMCTDVERSFLRKLEGGCTAPIGALAKINDRKLEFEGVLFSKDGSKALRIKRSAFLDEVNDMGLEAAEALIEKGAKRLMKEDQRLDANVYIASTKKLSQDQVDLIPENLGIEDADFIKIRYNRLSSKEFDQDRDISVFSSKNAVLSLNASVDKDIKKLGEVYCVGRRTKRMIESQWGIKVKAVAPSASALAEKMKDIKAKRITYFCGDLRLDTLPDALAKSNELTELICYRTKRDAKVLKHKPSVVLFYSPSGIESFLEKNDSKTTAVCIGQTTANAADGKFENVIVAKIPSIESMIESALAHLEEKNA